MVVLQRSEIFSVLFNRHCFFVCLTTTCILLLIDHIIDPIIKTKSQSCDGKRIQEHYMNNLR